MRVLIRRFAVAASAAVLLLGPAAGVAAPVNAVPAAPVGTAVPRWSITPSPNPRAANGALNAMSCPTTSVCTGVGFHVRASGLGVTLAERRIGGVWAVQSTPNPAGAAASALNGVSCPSGSACTAVGAFAVKSGAQLTLAERWNGGRWRIQPTPNPAGSPASILAAVACPTADSCTAVGASNSKLLVERWGGGPWRIQPAPVPAGAQFSELNGISCAAASSCIAVGDYVNGLGLDVTLAERWNGTRWRIQPTPSPAGTAAAVLFGVSCTSRSSCMAAGTTFNSSGQAGLFSERWNGATWHLQAVPAPAGAQSSLLLNVSCAASSCEAVGEYNDSSGATVTLGERWNGSTWHAQSTPNPAKASGNSLSGVSCPSASDCTAVGLGNGAGTPVALGERWNGTRWSLQAVPSPVGAAENQLNWVACPAINACIAVGTVGPTRGVFSTEALRWNGRAWRLQHTPNRAAGSALFGVDCTAPSACTAVGASNVFTPNGMPLAERWNGTRWTIQPTPNPSPGGFLNSVACTSASSCTAVGARLDSAGNPASTLAERWNGTRWTIQPTPNPSGSPGSFLVGVACTSAWFCTAVGARLDSGGNPVGTLAERWNGTRWAIQPTPNPSPGGILAAVSCTSMNACTAAGNLNATSNAGTTTLAERWNGTKWTIQPTPALSAGQGSFFNGVACKASACTAVGLYLTNTGPLTLAERWNGTSWTIQPTPLLPAVHEISPPAVACPAQLTCIAVGGFENDGPGSKTLTEQWRGSGMPAAQTAPAGYSAGAYPGFAGCLRAAMGAGFAMEAAATRIGARFKAPISQRSLPGSEIERITSLCGAI